MGSAYPEVCDVCGAIAHGYEIDFDAWEINECENGHVFCDSEMIGFELSDEEQAEEYKKRFEEVIEEAKHRIKNCEVYGRCDREHKELLEQALAAQKENDLEFLDDYYEEDRKERDPRCCPICTMTHIRESDLMKYLRITNTTPEQGEKEIREKFKTFEEFDNFLEKGTK